MCFSRLVGAPHPYCGLKRVKIKSPVALQLAVILHTLERGEGEGWGGGG